jgi:hypothetical protein
MPSLDHLIFNFKGSFSHLGNKKETLFNTAMSEIGVLLTKQLKNNLSARTS